MRVPFGVLCHCLQHTHLKGTLSSLCVCVCVCVFCLHGLLIRRHVTVILELLVCALTFLFCSALTAHVQTMQCLGNGCADGNAIITHKFVLNASNHCLCLLLSLLLLLISISYYYYYVYRNIIGIEHHSQLNKSNTHTH